MLVKCLNSGIAEKKNISLNRIWTGDGAAIWTSRQELEHHGSKLKKKKNYVCFVITDEFVCHWRVYKFPCEFFEFLQIIFHIFFRGRDK